MKRIFTLISVTILSLMLIGCDGTPEHGTNNAILNNIDYNIAVQNQKIDDLKSKAELLNNILLNIDKNIVIISTHTAYIAKKS